jgi:hypothetical protein
LSNLPRRSGIVRAARRPQLGFSSFARETAIGVFVKNQSNFVCSMTTLRLFVAHNRLTWRLPPFQEDRISGVDSPADATPVHHMQGRSA